VKLKYVAKTMYYLLYIDVVLRLNGTNYRIMNNTTEWLLLNLSAWVLTEFMYIQLYWSEGGGAGKTGVILK